MNHDSKNFTEAIGVSEDFMKFIVYSVAVFALKKKEIHDSRSGVLEAIVNGLEDFWEEYPKIYNSMNKRERLIIMLGIFDNVSELLNKTMIFKENRIINIIELLTEQANIAKIEYYENKED